GYSGGDGGRAAFTIPNQGGFGSANASWNGGNGASYFAPGVTGNIVGPGPRGDGSITITWTSDLPVSVTVTFNSGRGLPHPGSVTVAPGKSVSAPTSPAVPGATFVGWYTSAQGGTQWKFSNPVTHSMTLYAHWKPFVGPNVDTGAHVVAAAHTGESEWLEVSLVGSALFLLAGGAGLLRRR
ncbi:MAG TPA: InlB B-repeat-containing protein, partial [Marmoricola sp.]|nr:InlB B-repeat-containing protein [Marmoricola sp.]